MHWHYSQAMPMPPLVPYGVWEGGRYVGAVVFGRGANKDLGTRYGLDSIEVAELVRVALRNHDAPVSQIVARAVSLLKATNPGLRLLVSFADPTHQHHGGIYQAMNWIYTGTTTAMRAWQAPDGRRLHNRMVSKTGYGVQFGKATTMAKTADMQRISIPGKYRYLLPLDKAMRRRVAHRSLPYPPKLAVEASAGDAPTYPVGEAGSTPADRSTSLINKGI